MKKDLYGRIDELEMNINQLINEETTDTYELLEIAQESTDIREALEKATYKAAVVGSFAVGKSTFLNAMLGQAVLSTADFEKNEIITTIHNSTHTNATVHFKDGTSILLPINTLEECNHLNDYLDKNTQQEVEFINIQYAFLNPDDEVILMDTPSMKNLSPELVEQTKISLKDADAVIVVIAKRELDEKEIDLLKADYMEGKDKFVIVNQIGAYYNNNSKAAADLKIENVKLDIQEQLSKCQVDDVKIYAVDSRDYLWSVDSELYYRQRKLAKFNELRPQEDYAERSHYKEFSKDFFELLRTDNKEKKLLNDLEDRIVVLEECIREIKDADFQLKEDIRRQRKEELLEEKTRLMNFAINLKQELARDMNQFTDTYLHTIEQEVKTEQEKIGKLVPEHILNFIPNAAANTYENHQKVYKDIQRESRRLCDKFRNSLQNFILSTNEYVGKKYSDSIKSVNVNIPKLKFSHQELKLSYQDETNLIEIEDFSWEDGLKQDIKELEMSIAQISEQIAKNDELIDEKNQLLKQYDQIEIDWQNAKRSLGQRPSSAPIFQHREQNEGVWFWGKVAQPKQIDESEGKDWDMKYENFYKTYEEQLHKWYEAVDTVEEQLADIVNAKRKIQVLNEDLASTNQQLQNIMDEHQLARLKNAEYYLNRDREDLGMQINIRINKTLYRFIDDIKLESYRQNGELKRIINKLLNEAIQHEAEKIDKQIEKLLAL
ncbi:MAG: hypothetical protein BEN18_02600 [Epulopiscium sp. Nuni2H_MBin001]|nr:MAG: hypothetical protein BEN18_02600 [Epulopiscium sp. Nuni2H_MBin001]